MDNDEEMIEDINDEIVSSEDTTPEYIEEQPVEDVPSNSNRGGFVNGLKDGYHQYKNNDKGMADRLQAAKNKKNTTGSGHIGTDIGNKLTGKNEEDKSGAEKLSEDVGGKVAGKGITAATGGLIHGKAAEELGRLGLQTMKDQMNKKFKKYKIALFIGGGLIIFVIIFVVIFMNNDDPSTSSSDTNNYVTGDMDKSELIDYLNYIGICPSLDTVKKTFEDSDNLIDAIIESNEMTKSCRNALTYYKLLKQEYEENLKACPVMNASTPIDKDKPACEVTLPTLLIMETMSYGLSDLELFNKEYDKRYVNYGEDLRKLSFASTEYVYESCYIMVRTYTDSKGYTHSSPCDGCTEKTTKKNMDLYYYQISFDKYYSYLKYGDTSTHLNYHGLPFLKGENHDHECIGPQNDEYTSSANAQPVSDTNINVTSSNYCSDVYCSSYTNTTAKTECVKGCNNLKNSCANNKCKGLNNFSTSSYISCMDGCVN